MADTATTGSYDNDRPNNDRRDNTVEHREQFRQRAEEELRVSEKRFRTVIEQSPLSIHVFAPDGRSLLANSSWNELWNLEKGEEPEGINLELLPSGSPELQPAQRLWPLTTEVLANRLLEEIEELEEALVERCVQLLDQAEAIRDLTDYHWWPQVA